MKVIQPPTNQTSSVRSEIHYPVNPRSTQSPNSTDPAADARSAQTHVLRYLVDRVGVSRLLPVLEQLAEVGLIEKVANVQVDGMLKEAWTLKEV
jgi:hypothetical protein